MKGIMINPALQFIQTVGVSGLVSGVQTGMVQPQQALTAFRAVGTVIDAYSQSVPEDTALADLRRSIGGLPAQGSVASEVQEKILGLLTARSEDVELAVRMAIKINAVGQAVVAGAAAVVNLESPFDLGAELRWIPPGIFQMGSAEDDPYADIDEKPLVTVVAGGIWMLDHPVTNAEFRAFLEAAGRKDVRGLSHQFAGEVKPAVKVTHGEAMAYSKWLGEQVSKRTGRTVTGNLPAEAQWERAAKGPNGDEFIKPAAPEQAHFGAKATRAVNHPAAYANGFGLKDMIGNVWEWTSSPWERRSYKFVIRGASWLDYLPNCLRAAYRRNGRPDDRASLIGFRPVLVPQGFEG